MTTYAERSKDQRQQLVDDVLKMMETGNLDWQLCWQPGTFAPYNPITKTRYHGINRLWLASVARDRQYTDPRWLTFNQIANAGLKLQKGSKGAHIEKWGMVIRGITEALSSDEVDARKSRYPTLQRMYVVFNGNCIDSLEPLPDFSCSLTGDERVLEVADQLIETLEADFCESTTEEAWYRPVSDLISVPARNRFITTQDFFATLSHEAAHSTGHIKRLDRGMMANYGSESYAQEELVAELSALFTQAAFGFDDFGHVKENSAAYLQSWISRLRSKPQELFGAMNDAEKSTDYLLERYLAKHENAAIAA